jgi:dolichol-phosphate mannosyltransferase
LPRFWACRNVLGLESLGVQTGAGAESMGTGAVVSVVLPVHNERENLAPLLEEIEQALARQAREIVAVDDGSTDGSWEELRRLATRISTLRTLRLQRHCGQSAALAAGIEAARGDIVLTLDADGQYDPRDAAPLLAALDADAALQAAVGYRASRADGRWKRLQSVVATAVRNRLTGDRVRDTGCGLKAMRRRAVLELPRFDGMHRFLPTLIRSRGGKVTEFPVRHRPRQYGASHYAMVNRALRGLWDALAVRWWRRRALVYTVKED